MGKGFSIGQAARVAGTKVQTVRYYEQIGLLPEPDRTAGNQRVYDRSRVERLSFIRRARELGFSLGAIRDLLNLSNKPSAPCEAVDAITNEQLAEVRLRIARLTALEGELERMLQTCSGGRVGECRIIEAMGNGAKGSGA